MAATKTENTTKVVTRLARISFPYLMEPHARQGTDEAPKYSVTVLVPKKDTATMAAIHAAIDVAKKEGAEKRWGGMPKIVPTPIHDGDGQRPSDGEDYGPECKGHWVFTASSKNAPDVLDRDGNPITNATDVYGGMYGYVGVRFFPYAFGGKKGVGCALLAVQKRKDGEPLGSQFDARAEFAKVADDDDDEEELPF
jgi:hypothetical protein